MSALQSIDNALFRFINLKLSNPVFDAIMPGLSSNGWFIPAVILLGVGLFWKGGTRGRLFVIVLVLSLAVGDALVINNLKYAIGRPRPFMAIDDARVLVGMGRSNSMPSSHAATWAAAALIALIYYPRSRWFFLPFAFVMAFSRVYLGVHYPSDALVGMILGAGYAAGCLWLFSQLWRFVGRRWFPIWWERHPALVLPPDGPAPVQASRIRPADRETLADAQWRRVAYLLIALALAGRLYYIGSDRVDLSEDEAYQWVWSKHLALSYYSKPPMIALAQFTGTSLWGDTEFGVRFLAPVLGAIVALMVFRFMQREASPRVAMVTVLVLLATPMLVAGSSLMTIDPLLVTFWTGAIVAGWRAVQPGGSTRDWLWVGLCSGLAFLSKYSALFLVPCFALYFILWKPARVQLRKPGPWLAILVLLVSMIPVALWNAQNGWITVKHVSENAKLEKAWSPTLRYFLEFTGAEAGLLNPVFFVGVLVTLSCFWAGSVRRPLQRYLFCLGAPVFLGYWAYTFHSRVQPNWIAPAVVPLLCLMVLFWRDRWKTSSFALRTTFKVGIAFGLVASVLISDTSLISRLTGSKLPAKIDPTRRIRGIEGLAKTVGRSYRDLAAEASPVFIITSHYGLAGQLSFYLPEARKGIPGQPLVYPRFTQVPKNQFYFWPEYRYWQTRRGQNALYVVHADDGPRRVPEEVSQQFGSVTDLGLREISERGQVLHRIHLFALRNLL